MNADAIVKIRHGHIQSAVHERVNELCRNQVSFLNPCKQELSLVSVKQTDQSTGDPLDAMQPKLIPVQLGTIGAIQARLVNLGWKGIPVNRRQERSGPEERLISIKHVQPSVAGLIRKR